MIHINSIDIINPVKSNHISVNELLHFFIIQFIQMAIPKNTIISITINNVVSNVFSAIVL